MAKQKHEVDVVLVAKKRVRMTVEVEEGDSPTDLTEAELDRAANIARFSVPDEWDVESVRAVE
jgi:hypothetical protein